MKVRIYKPAKNAMQSGLGKTQVWALEYDDIAPRGPEPLMGWTSGEDTLNQVKLYFGTREEAEEFAKGKGWEYVVASPRQRRVRPRNYGDNFKYFPPTEESA